MADLPVSEFHDPVRIAEEDHNHLRSIQVKVDSLSKYRQEIGRLMQAMNNMISLANDNEISLAKERRELADKYGLEKIGTGQWAIDFEKKEFVRVAEGAPVIP